MPIEPLPQPKIGFGACVNVVGQIIYIAGGTEGEQKKPTNECYAYHINDNTWWKIA